jgi:hypothetical protein
MPFAKMPKTNRRTDILPNLVAVFRIILYYKSVTKYRRTRHTFTKSNGLYVNNVSTFFDNVGTDKYKRVYAEVSRKKKDSGKKPSNVMQVEEKCHYVGSGMVIR